jgi:thiol-disulfide isomerase/thioredoxin
MKNLFCILTLLCLIQLSQAQAKAQPLAIGDSIPDTPFEYFNYSRPTGNFADLRDGFVIFDFWRPSCLPCVRNLPKLDSLQQAYPGLRVFLITSTPRHKIEKFYNNGRDSLSWMDRLHHIVNDTTFSHYFSFNTIPTYVWIRKGVLWQITKSDELTADRIRIFMGLQ